jgi:hypothetical protein
MLRRVSIRIQWFLRGYPDDMLEGLEVKEDKFRRLVESKAVEFIFSSEIMS